MHEQLSLEFPQKNIKKPDPQNNGQSVAEYYEQLCAYNEQQNGGPVNDKDPELLRNQITSKPDRWSRFFDGKEVPVRFKKPRRKK